MWGHGMGWDGWWSGGAMFGLGHLLWWALVLLAIVALVRRLTKAPGRGPGEDRALEILRERCARRDQKERVRRAQERSRVTTHHRSATATALLAEATLVQTQVVAIDWTPAGTFDHRFGVAPGKFAELCGPLAKGQSVQWRFEAGGALDFNIHYHQDKDVIYPTRASGTQRTAGALAVDSAQEYCWMWTNKSATAVELTVTLNRR